MTRYLKVTFLIGGAVGAAVLALYHYQLLHPLDAPVQQALGLPAYTSALRWPYQYALIPLLALGIAWTTVDITRTSLKAVVAVGVLLQLIAMTYVTALYDHFFAPSGPVLAAVLSFLVGLIYSRTDAGRRKRSLSLLFGRRVSPSVFREMVDGEVPSGFSGEKTPASILLCEVFNHEDLMGALSPEEYVEMLNLHLSTASQFLVERGAYIDECDGEGLRALFGAPLPDPGHARAATLAALELDKRLRNLNLDCDARWHQTLDYRIGLTSGDLIVGAYGSARLGGFSAAGETVDFARRLCAANMVFGTRILLDPATFEGVADAVEVRPVEMIRASADGDRIELYEPLAAKGELDETGSRLQSLFWEGVVFYRERRWDLAMERFSAATQLAGGDAPAEFYLRRIERSRTGASPHDLAGMRPLGFL